MLENFSGVSVTDGEDVDMGTGVVVMAFVVVFDKGVVADVPTGSVCADIGLAVYIVLFSTLLDSLVVTGIVSFWTNAGVFGSIVLVCDGVEATIVDEIFEVLSVVRFILPGWLGAGDVSLDTLEALFAGAFAFSGWLGAGDPGRLWFQTVWVPLLMLRNSNCCLLSYLNVSMLLLL